MNQLVNQIAVVTGAGRGIGRAIALKFASEGADVVCVSRTAENSEKVAGEIRALNRKAWAYAVDVADSGAVAAAAEKILTETNRVDVLVNNAGVTRDGLVVRMKDDDWDTVLNTNLKGAFAFTRALARGFLKQRSGRIINVASVIGLMGNAGQCNYAASKAALIGFTKSIARELASRGVTVNALHPGLVATNLFRGYGPFGALVKLLLRIRGTSPAVGARTIVYLATAPEVAGVTGRYFFKQRAVPSSQASYDLAAANRLWEVSDALTDPPV